MDRNIRLANGKLAIYRSTRLARIPDISKEKDVEVHEYIVPCPNDSCGSQSNFAQSLDGIYFFTHQISCRRCGVFYRPVVDPESVKAKLLIKQVTNPT